MASKKFIVGVTACQIGIAHTFMAAESLTKAIEARGCEAKIETQGATCAEQVRRRRGHHRGRREDQAG